MMTTNEAINAAAAGEPSPVAIYWDDQNPANEGVAYKYRDGSDSGAAVFAGWNDGHGGTLAKIEVLRAFFDGDGTYLGPTIGGVYPTFKAG